MRILSLGCPLPGPSIDNHNFLSAPSFFDYDALIVNPHDISQNIEDVLNGGEHETFAGERIVNGAAGPGCVSIAELLRNRTAETARMLARGGIVVCLTYPNATHKGVDGLDCLERYYWLPAPSGLRYDAPFMTRGGGRELQPTERDDPFGELLANEKEKLAYQVHFDEKALSDYGHVIARSAGGAAVAIEMQVAGGRIVLLPPPARTLESHSRYELSEALQSALRQALRLASASSAPLWLRDYALPGLDERQTAQHEARTRLTEAQATLETSTGALDELQRHQRLLWEEGRYGLEEAVRGALALLGFRVTPDALDAPGQIETEGPALQRHVAMLETDASAEAVGLDAHYRLRRRIEDALASGSPKRGLLVINGYRRTPPAERPQQYANELRVAAEQLRYCLATTEQLFHAVRASLNGDDATVERFRDRLLTTESVLQED